MMLMLEMPSDVAFSLSRTVHFIIILSRPFWRYCWNGPGSVLHNLDCFVTWLCHIRSIAIDAYYTGSPKSINFRPVFCHCAMTSSISIQILTAHEGSGEINCPEVISGLYYFAGTKLKEMREDPRSLRGN